MIVTAKMVCSLKGHKPVNKIKETDAHIYGKSCNRCGISLPPVHFKLGNSLPPPDSTKEEIEEWKLFCKIKDEEFREEHGSAK
jgi:hypothetical protein